MTQLAYQTDGGAVKLLTKSGGLCTTCCAAYYTLGKIWVDNSLCGVHFVRAGSTQPFWGTEIIAPGYYWRIWDFTAITSNKICKLSYYCSYAGTSYNATGNADSSGELQVYDTISGYIKLSQLPIVRNFYAMPDEDHYVYVQISPDGVSWPTQPPE